MIQEKDQHIKGQEEQILAQKNEILQLENKLNSMTEQRDLAVVKLDQKVSKSDYLNERAIVLEKQIQSLSDAQLNCEQSIQKLLDDKLKLVNDKFEDLLKQDTEMKQIKLSDYFIKSFNFNYEVYSLG